jgi:uncharacterized protein YodC (DUF2158 family)
METFKVGDVVRLRGSYVDMAVEGFDKGRVLCAWFEKKGNSAPVLKRDSFVPETLDLMPTTQSPVQFTPSGY